MALDVETGSGSATSESYASVADADTYAVAYIPGCDWQDSLDAQKERALRLATQAIDAQNQSRWQGNRASGTQALSWPRSGVEVDGYTLASTLIPTTLKNATIELAVKYRTDPTTSLVPDNTAPGTIVEEFVKVGDIEERVKYSGGKGNGTSYTLVENLLAPLTHGGSADLVGTMERA